MLTLDAVLLYYDNPTILDHLFARTINHSDILRFKKYIRFIIADTGTPIENVEATKEVVQKWSNQLSIDYVRLETDHIRARVPEGLSDRPASHGLNTVLREVSEADIFMTIMIGQVLTPNYFSNLFAEHMKHPRAVILPKRFDLKCPEYHEKYYDVPFDQIDRSKMVPSGGLPDMSVRREFLLDTGGWDESYITIAPSDSDMCSRLCGKLDNGMPSEALHPDKGAFNNYGLEFVQPFSPNFFSLVCNTYKNHVEGESRKKSYDIAYQIYLDRWGIVNRNETPENCEFTLEKFT